MLSPDADRFGFLGFGLNERRRVGCIHAVRSKPSEKWGYWGGYRDRFAASSADTFEPASEIINEPIGDRVTRGKRIIVQLPKNVCFVREGAETTYITNAQEREGWNTKVKPVFEKWIAYLRDNPTLSGGNLLARYDRTRPRYRR